MSDTTKIDLIDMQSYSSQLERCFHTALEAYDHLQGEERKVRAELRRTRQAFRFSAAIAGCLALVLAFTISWPLGSVIVMILACLVVAYAMPVKD